MKAFLLAAGRGTRLKPLTDEIPKCLIPIDGIPLLGHWFNLFEKYGVSDVLINTHHLSQKVEEFVKGNPRKFNVYLVHEPELLGSAGTLKKNAEFVKSENEFFIFYADNLVDINLKTFLDFHRSHDGIITVGLFRTDNPCGCGIVSLDGAGKIIDFEEKPRNPRSNLASAGVFIAKPQILDFIPDKFPSDIGFDLLPKIIKYGYGVLLDGYLRDIGTMESYKKAQFEWRKYHDN